MTSNQASPVSTNQASECAKAFPGLKASFEEIVEWRKHPGYSAKNDPFLNGQIAKEVEERAKEIAEDEEYQRTPEFELSRKLDEAMREVYKHLHDTFTDKTYEGQDLKLNRAYSAITKFQMDHTDELTQVQTASIAVTRDQVAKFQADLKTGEKPLAVSMELLEQSFARMNQWRPEDDPMKTMTLEQYINEKKREEHAAFVASKEPTPDVKKMLQSGIEVNITEAISQIEALARAKDGFGDKGLFFGVNFGVLCRNGDVMPGGRFIDCKTEAEWKALEPCFAPMQLVASGQKLPGEQDFFSELTDVRHDGIKLVVQYFVVELDDRRHPENPVHKDPRAQLLPEVLSGKVFHGDAIVQVWAHIKQLDAYDKERDEKLERVGERKKPGEPHEEHDAPDYDPSEQPVRTPASAQLRSLSPALRGMDDSFGNVDGEDDDPDPMVQWSKPIVTKGGVSTLRHEANKLMERAKRVAELGDHKTAYELAAQGHTLRQQADDVEASSSSAEQSQSTDEPKVYKPEVKYEYPSGEARVIESGYYTETEHMKRSMEEQELLVAVKTATAAGIEKAKLTPDQMSKYETPLSRSMSAADSMTTAEKLAPALRDNAAKTREVMRTSRETTPESSPPTTPAIAAQEGLPQGAISFKLPEDLARFGTNDQPTMDEMGMTDAERDHHEFS